MHDTNTRKQRDNGESRLTGEQADRFQRRSLCALIILVGAMVSVACGGDAGTPSPALTPTAIPTVAPTDTPALTPIEEPARRRDTKEGSLRVFRSRSAVAPARLELFGFHNASPLSIARQSGGVSGLTVSVNGSVTVEADEAYVVVVPERSFGPGGPQGLSSKDRTEVIENLTAIGISEGDIEFESNPRFGPFGVNVSVEVRVEDLPGIGDRILDAVEEVLRRSQASGVRFSLSEEHCTQALALARRQAIPDAQDSAADLAEALGVRRGGVIGAVEFSRAGAAPFGPSLDRCVSQSAGPYALSLQPFDASREVEVSVGVQVTYAME